MKRALLTLAGLVVLGAGGFLAYAWRSEIPVIARPQASSFEAEQVRHGAELAALGNCNTCHTAPGGKVFAGGLALPTPFGTIYSTNITPDQDTGIGRWSQAAFTRAMREGVDRQGRHLYPAFPYDHFTHVTDADNQALYAYLMTRTAVHAEAPPNALPFPLNIRLVLAGWKMLFFRQGELPPDPGKDAVWNRGAYLAEGLEHCGACHTPRNLLGAEKRDQHFAGGEAEGWTAYALNAASPSPIPWTVDTMTDYLRHGWQREHGVARGSMAEVTANLGSVNEQEIRAIATYVVDRMGPPAEGRQERARAVQTQALVHPPGAMIATAGSQTVPIAASAEDRGAAIYAGACSSCHDAGRPLPFGGIKLAYSTAVYGPNPTNPINVILYGLPAPEGERGPIMPGFGGALNDDQIADLLVYLRKTFSDRPPWDDPKALVQKIRAGDLQTKNHATDGQSSAPANPSKRETSW